MGGFDSQTAQPVRHTAAVTIAKAARHRRVAFAGATERKQWESQRSSQRLVLHTICGLWQMRRRRHLPF